MILFIILIYLFNIKSIEFYEILPNSLLNRTQICQINCIKNQTINDKFKKISNCIKDEFKICESYLTIDFNTKFVSYSFTTPDINEINKNLSLFINYINNDITAIRFRQLKMKFSKENPYQCAYQEIETIYPVYINNQYILKRIQPMFYDESILFGTKIECMNDVSTEQTSLCSGYCTLKLGLHTMSKSCNETLSTDALGINMSLGLSYPNNPIFTDQVSSLELVCNKPNCNSNTSIREVIAIANAFLTAQSIGIRIIIIHWLLLLISLSLITIYI